MERTETTDPPTPDDGSAPPDEPSTRRESQSPPGVRTYRVDVEPVAGNGTPAGEPLDVEAAELAAAHAAALEDAQAQGEPVESVHTATIDADTSGGTSSSV